MVRIALIVALNFRDNAWYCIDAPDKSRQTLPAEETGGLYGVDPKLKGTKVAELIATEPRVARLAGADALPATTQPD